jgi:hypothetical protein
MKKEVARLLKKVDLLSKEERYTQEYFGRAVKDKVAEVMSNFVATSVAKHAADLAKASVAAACLHDAKPANAVARLAEKCKEVEHLKENLLDLENVEDRVNGDDNFPWSKNEDGENVELASVGTNAVSCPIYM